MPEDSFDITSILQFKPPKGLCERCCAILLDWPPRHDYDEDKSLVRCPICEVDYIPTKQFPTHWGFFKYLKTQGLYIEFDDLIGHSQKLATIAHNGRNFFASPREWPFYHPIRVLLEALLSAEKFVHFTTYGISDIFIGAIKVIAQRVSVRGIISGVQDERRIKELTEYELEAPELTIRLSDTHQKIIVIDGLMAFKGSTNLTVRGWRNAAEGRDLVELVTDVKEVVELHNRYFSPIWASFSKAGPIGMESIPF